MKKFAPVSELEWDGALHCIRRTAVNIVFAGALGVAAGAFDWGMRTVAWLFTSLA